jgi:hypothetical protein
LKAPVRWPEGVQSALCLTVDIDGETMWTSVDPNNALRPFVIGQAEYEFKVGIPLFLELFERHGVRTTFFVCGGVALAHPESIRAIHAAGHEVACHGWLHEPTHGFSWEDELAYIKRSTATGRLPRRPRRREPADLGHPARARLHLLEQPADQPVAVPARR